MTYKRCDQCLRIVPKDMTPSASATWLSSWKDSHSLRLPYPHVEVLYYGAIEEQLKNGMSTFFKLNFYSYHQPICSPALLVPKDMTPSASATWLSSWKDSHSLRLPYPHVEVLYYGAIEEQLKNGISTFFKLNCFSHHQPICSPGFFKLIVSLLDSGIVKFGVFWEGHKIWKKSSVVL